MLVDAYCGLCIGCAVFCFVLSGFVLDCGIIVLFVDYRVPGLHCAGGMIGTWLVCLTTVSFLMGVRTAGAYVIIGPRAIDCILGLVRYHGILGGFRKRVTVMNSRNTVIVNPRILYEVKTDTGEITNYHGSSSSMSTAANVIPYRW